jgi:hypothetical protein
VLDFLSAGAKRLHLGAIFATIDPAVLYAKLKSAKLGRSLHSLNRLCEPSQVDAIRNCR